MHRAGDASVRLPDRPSPKRLPLGEPSTSGAPYSVQAGHYESGLGGSSGPGAKSAQFPRSPCVESRRCPSPDHQGGTERTYAAAKRTPSGILGAAGIGSADVRSGAKKCTEPVAPSSGFPTDIRRSGCRSESHQPRTLRTRCTRDSRDRAGGRQGSLERRSRKLRSFLFAQDRTALCRACSTVREERRPDPCGPGRTQSSPSRERFRPPSRRTFRFRVVLLGRLRPTGAPCSAHAGLYDSGRVLSRGYRPETSRKLRTRQPIQAWPFQYARSRPRRSSSRCSSSGGSSPGVANTWKPSAACTSSNSRSGRSVAASSTHVLPRQHRYPCGQTKTRPPCSSM